MISFIVIGKNEGWRLKLCFASISKVIEMDRINDYEIIYVDSNSSDDSINIASRYPSIQCYIIDGYCNAAIARNIGSKEAKGEILFFVDGDMEIQPGFIPLILNGQKLIYPFISGVWLNRYYNFKWEYLSSGSSHHINKDTYEDSTGGLFVIDRAFWRQLHGMDVRLDRQEDLDFGYRMKRIGYPLLRKTSLLAIHHTIDYTVRSGSKQYYLSTGVLLRKHFLSSLFFRLLFNLYYTIIILFISIILSCFLSPFFLMLYFVSVLYKSLRMKSRVNSLDIFPTIWYYLLRDIIIIFSFMFYYPSDRGLLYHKIQNESDTLD